MEKHHHHERSTFSGKLGFVLSAAGASVGLGNIWRFPYLAAKYGGGIFLLIYIIREFDSLFSSNTSQSLYWLYFFVKIKFYLYTLHCVVV